MNSLIPVPKIHIEIYNWVLAMWKAKAAVPVLLASAAATTTFDIPESGNSVWSSSPGVTWANDFFPIGNGYLAAMTPGGTNVEMTQLNIESLWSGGPFADSTYNGGNKLPSDREAMASAMNNIQNTILNPSGNGTIEDISILTTDPGAYGSYAASGWLVTTMDTDGAHAYKRWLDLDAGLVRTQWSDSSNTTYTRTTLCSHSAKACIQHLNSTASNSTLPSISLAFSSDLEATLPIPNVTCIDENTLNVRGYVAVPGMLYELIFRVLPEGGGDVVCTESGMNATISIANASSIVVAWVGDTEYDMDKGNANGEFSFRGHDPHDTVVELASNLDNYTEMFHEHVDDYTSLTGAFSLDLGQVTPSPQVETSILKDAYTACNVDLTGTSTAQTDCGNPYLEWITFNFGRYLLVSSARGTLPANLQGKWGRDISNPWGADYHSNINIQMNYWSAEMLGLGTIVRPLFDYFEKTWAPRGGETAQNLYNINQGWVTHDEMNIFGHTGMKGPGDTAQWSDYPESNAWMMIHVWDHFDYTRDIAWFQSQGWWLLKGVAQFHMAKLLEDTYFEDGTLVTAPCNSPEQVPITLGCAHSQQLLWQLFNAVEKGYNVSGDVDSDFIEEVGSKKAKMDLGIHIGSWGQLQEWKVDMDSPTDTHRHLSHLVGVYPGYAVLAAANGINGSGVMEAAKTSLIARGNGTGPDADAGWEKAWRAAVWAQLGNADNFYGELTYTISRNFGPNLLSLYDPADSDPIFQIDANLGYLGATLNALIQAPDTATLSDTLAITIFPALPAQWLNGKISGARVRGGIVIDLQWSGGTLITANVSCVSEGLRQGQLVEVIYEGKIIDSFQASKGISRLLKI